MAAAAAAAAAAEGGGGDMPAPARAPALPRDKLVVLVSPTFYRQRKAFYGAFCVVRPLLFRWASLTADHIKRIMRVDEKDSQLYVATMLNMLRTYQRAGVIPAWHVFIEQIREACSVKGQSGPLDQRLALLETLVRESRVNADIAGDGADLAAAVAPGTLVVADMTDPLLSSAEANGIFQVLVEQFRALPVRGGKFLALDEAHKFMDGGAATADGLSDAIVDTARLMRHDGLRLFVSTQSPLALAPELLELVTIAVMHRFHSKDWHTYLAKKLPLPDGSFEALRELQPGHALAFATRALVDRGGDAGDGQGESLLAHLRVRQRITADRGATRTNR